ncbi:hypothetical protein CLV94_0264 [Flavobacterium endophyticum]|uniref:DUF6438 domain-containing protein n=1 Tax=Flavobacterium endophyticum TaxID=1540163 RepID=A0A495MGZ4_9FLAO|nr:DUF6438 domain-containing protein [Flavobacterium endophyticum]RKS25234.1 hypothetical protein CLV94_0264 [Flavobacterium endophyticum]
MRNLILVFSILSIILGCNKNSEFSANNDFRDSLIGDWEEIIRIDSNHIYIEPIFSPTGYSFSKDNIEFFNGLFDIKNDTSKRYRTVKYLGNFKKYKIEGNQLFTKNLKTKKWQEFWKIKHIKNDTLFIINEGKSIGKLKRLKYKIEEKNDFDKIVYSSLGCYGTCPIIDISLDRSGNINFQGNRFVDEIGFYKGKLDKKTTAFIFRKFEKADITNLEDNYSDAVTDSQTITTTFIKNGKIVKSIQDYAFSSTKELIWAYVPIGNIFKTMTLTKITPESNFTDIALLSFSKGEKTLNINGSEGFFLWTELQKGQLTRINFAPTYKISYTQNKNTNLKEISSDGRFYKLEFKNNHTITYDLGYNFIERNFKEKDFEKEKSLEDFF